MSEEKQGGFFFGLVIRGEIEPDLVTGLKVPCVRHEWNPIAHFLADRNRFKRLTGKLPEHPVCFRFRQPCASLRVGIQL